MAEDVPPSQVLKQAITKCELKVSIALVNRDRFARLAIAATQVRGTDCESTIRSKFEPFVQLHHKRELKLGPFECLTAPFFVGILGS